MSLSLRGIQHGFCQVRKQLFLGSRSNSRTMVLVQINLVTLGSRSGTTEPQSLVAAGTEGPGERRGSPGPGACGCLGTWGGAAPPVSRGSAARELGGGPGPSRLLHGAPTTCGLCVAAWPARPAGAMATATGFCSWDPLGRGAQLSGQPDVTPGCLGKMERYH